MRRWTLLLFAPLSIACSSSAEVPAAVDDTGTNETNGDEGLPSDVVGDVPGETESDASADAPTDATSSGGCGKAATSGVTNESITVAGTKRTYVLSIPTGYDPAKPLPLVFGWHGRTGNGAGFRTYGGAEKAAGGKAIFVYPDGLPVTADPKDTGWELTAKGRDVALFDALRGDLINRLCIDEKRVFSYGFSFGGYMSNTLGCARSTVVRAIAPIAGGGPFFTCGGPVAAWLIHATDDGVVAIAEGIKSRDLWIKASGCDAGSTTKVAPDPCVGYAGCKASAPVVWCQSPTGGHSVPSWAGAAVWSFFASL